MDAAIRKAKDSINQMFEKNLHDLVRGIRNHKENESKYIATCIDEIKLELKQDNMAIKANAVNKLCYLQMMGYDISWAAFNIIEVMSSTKFTYKRIGYLAASQVFHDGTDVLMLTTNLLRKDLGSQNMYEAGIALNGLACFITPDLARDLAGEIMKLMTSNKPYLRKKAVLIMYKIFLNYPDSLRPSFPRLKEKLDDTDSSVQAAAVNVICELARKNPKNYLSLAPIFFKLMAVSTNNWVLIKIIKLFGALTPLEPRLGKKLIEPLTNIINSTSAMSLLYECINTVLAVLVSISSGQPNHNSAIQVCLQKLRILIEDSDQNLKYLGLLAMSKILQTNPSAVQTHKDLIMQCLDDKDESIRLRSLDLLYGMVSKKTLMEIIKKLMVHMNKAEGTHYRDELLAKIIDICSQNNYQYVTNFEWYVSVLVELTRMEGTRHGKLLANQMLDVAIRVESIRPFIVAQMSILLDNIHVFTSSNMTNTLSNAKSSSKDSTSGNICEVLYAATWICGEFSNHLTDPGKTLSSMLKSKIDNLPGHIQSSFVQNIFKIYCRLLKLHADEQALDECRELTSSVNEKLLTFEQSADIEVQERACSMLRILKYVLKTLNDEQALANVDVDESSTSALGKIVAELLSLYDGELNPVAPKAQKKVPIPEGLDLDAWINDPPSDSDDNEDASAENQIFIKSASNNQNNMSSVNKMTGITSISSSNYSTGSGSIPTSASAGLLGTRKVQPELSEEDLAKFRETRKLQLDSNPFYIKSASSMKKSDSNAVVSGGSGSGKTTESEATVRSQSIDLKVPLSIPGVSSSDKYYRMSKIDDENKRLKKKMKKKQEQTKGGKSKSKKSSKNNNQDNEDDEDEEEEEPATVKVLANEMPEGVLDVSDDDSSKKIDPKDPHRALDINLDEPLKADEVLPVPTHRSPTSNSINTDDKKNKLSSKKVDKAELKAEGKSKKEEKSSSKEKRKENGEKTSSKEKSSAAASTSSAKEAKKDKKKSSSSKSNKKSNSDSIDLLISTDQAPRSEQDYNELLSPEHESLPAEPAHSTNEQTKPTVVKEEDDLEFWLSTETSSKQTAEVESSKIQNGQEENGKPHKEAKSSSKKKSKSKEDDAEHETKKSSKKSKESNLHDNEGSEKKSHSKKSKSKNKEENGEHEKENGHVKVTSKYKLLASNNHLNIKYQAKPNRMNLNQLIVGIKLKYVDKSSAKSNIYSMELNLIETANVKIVTDKRDEEFQNSNNESAVRIPFTLSNDNPTDEYELYLHIIDCSFPQLLKGNLTYMLKSEDPSVGSIHDKVDFRLNIQCSSFLVENHCDNDEFSDWLTSGQLNHKRSIKIESLDKFDDINALMTLVLSNFTLTVIEIVDNNASLFGTSMKNHPICLLVKFLNDKSLTIDAKSTNSSLIENLLNEFNSVLTAS